MYQIIEYERIIPRKREEPSFEIGEISLAEGQGGESDGDNRRIAGRAAKDDGNYGTQSSLNERTLNSLIDSKSTSTSTSWTCDRSLMRPISSKNGRTRQNRPRKA